MPGLQQELTQIAGKLGVKLPTELSSTARSERAKLLKLSGCAFDKEFTRFETADFRLHLQQFKAEVASGSDPTLKSFAQQYSAVIQRHYDTAQRLRGGK